VKRLELTIEKLVYGGDGLARLASETVAAQSPSAVSVAGRAKTIFIPYVLPGESVEAAIVEDRPGFARAKLERLLTPSPLRTAPPCQYFGRCGGCHYQHITYDEQLRFKSEILRETLRRTAKLDLAIDIQTHGSPPLNYRNRTRFHVRTKPEFSIGYFRPGSHELLPIRECPISSALINRGLQQLWSLGEAGKVPAEIGEIELFANGIDERFMVELYLRAGSNRTDLSAFARDLAAATPGSHGIVSFERLASSAPGAAQPKSNVLYGEGSMTYEVAGESYRVSAGAFFQTNRFLLPRVLELAVGQRAGRLALDLYAGVGLFAVPLARQYERVVAVESSPLSADDLRANVPANVKVSPQSTEAYLTAVAGTLRPDLIIADPPRAGLGSKVCEQVSKLGAQEIIYVSCDPATFARDLKQLASDGWSIAELRLIDLFPQTFHIEACTVLTRP